MSFSLSWIIFCSSAYGCSHICVSIYEVLFTGLHFITGYKLPPRDRHLSVIDATWIKWDSVGVTTAALGYMGVPNIVMYASVSWVILQLPLCSHGHINVCNCAFLSHRASFNLRVWLASQRQTFKCFSYNSTWRSWATIHLMVDVVSYCLSPWGYGQQKALSVIARLSLYNYFVGNKKNSVRLLIRNWMSCLFIRAWIAHS